MTGRKAQPIQPITLGSKFDDLYQFCAKLKDVN
jgi:hypothetical protein